MVSHWLNWTPGRGNIRGKALNREVRQEFAKVAKKTESFPLRERHFAIFAAFLRVLCG